MSGPKPFSIFEKVMKIFNCPVGEEYYINILSNTQSLLISYFNNIRKYECNCTQKLDVSTEIYETTKTENFRNTWNILHECTFLYPDSPSVELQNLIYLFFNTEVKRIPCNICCFHYTQCLKSSDLRKACKTKHMLIRWLIDVHNDVNDLNKKSILTYDEVYKLYNYVK